MSDDRSMIDRDYPDLSDYLPYPDVRDNYEPDFDPPDEEYDGPDEPPYDHWLVAHLTIDIAIGYLTTHGYRVLPPEPEAVFQVRKTAPDTSQDVVVKMRAGTLQRDVLSKIATYSALWDGITDDELEELLGRTHQSVSAARNILVRKGLVTDSGLRRNTRSGNKAIVWTRTMRPSETTP